MADQLHFCIHGAGGLGTVVGAFLARSGHRVTLIARKPHVDAVNANGIRLEGVRAHFIQKDNISAVTMPDEVEGEIDYYILLTKAKGTDQALADAKVLVDRTKTAVTLQNGIGKEPKVQAVLGKDKVIGGSIMEGAVLAEPGYVRHHMAVPVTAYFGEIGGGQSDRTRTIAQALDTAGLGTHSVDDIEQVLWEKLVQVSGASGWSASTLSAIPDLDFWAGIQVREGAEHYVTIASELLAIYHAMGYRAQNFFAPVSRLKEIETVGYQQSVEDFIALGQRMAQKGHPVRTSMHDDLVAGRKMEVEEMFGPLVRKAEELNVKIPTFLGVYRLLSTLNHHLPREPRRSNEQGAGH